MALTLSDSYGRVIDYLRVSITDLCNLRCKYCRPPEGVKLVTHDDILRYEEILTIVDTARKLGVRKVRITGGEPLVRRGVTDFVRRLTSMPGLDDVALTTNGTRLAPMARDLRKAGLTRVNISLDSLRPETFAYITGADKLTDVLQAIHTALEVGFNPVKINVVLLQGTNEPDVPEFARMAIDLPVDVRFIERMPFAGDEPHDSPEPFSAHNVLHMIASEVGKLTPIGREMLDGPATMFKLQGAKGRIGIIDPITGHFCATCNRLRLTARGTLRPCLLGPAEIDIKTPLRNGAARNELAAIIQSAVNAKPAAHATCTPAMPDGMNMIGG